jgi:uncharacterized membrane protein HdeD (DUF308 family)
MFKTISTSLLWKGILAIAIGVVSVAWPGITVGAFVIVFAVYAFMVAAADGVRAFSSSHPGPVLGYLLLSILSAAAGVIALAWPGMTAMALTLFVGAWAFVTGAFEVSLAFRRGEPAGERAWWILGGLVSMALGVVLAIRPDAGAVTLATVFGLFSIVSGIGDLILSVRLRRAHASADSAFMPTTDRVPSHA